jgi:O-antigen/teichoic acid export membrane protein
MKNMLVKIFGRGSLYLAITGSVGLVFGNFISGIWSNLVDLEKYGFFAIILAALSFVIAFLCDRFIKTNQLL